VNLARIAFDGAAHLSIATGNWGCGAFGNDHILKFFQQWMAASEVCATSLLYHTFGDPRSAPLVELASSLQKMTVGELWSLVLDAAQEACRVFPPPMQKKTFLKMMTSGPGTLRATSENVQGWGEGNREVIAK
jgi:hypothetical protein